MATIILSSAGIIIQVYFRWLEGIGRWPTHEVEMKINLIGTMMVAAGSLSTLLLLQIMMPGVCSRIPGWDIGPTKGVTVSN